MKIFLLILTLSGIALAGVDFYSILGVGKSASKDDIRRAYKRLSIKYHPDKNSGDTDAQKKFIEVSNAYEVLSDDKKKETYDRYGEEGLKQQEQGGGGFHDPFDIFAQFSRGFGGRQQEPQEKKGPEIVMQLQVDLKDLYLGRIIEVEIDRHVLCPKCDGSGAKSAGDVKTCTVCNGRGIRIVQQQIAPGFVQQMQTTCNECGGKGKIVKSTCPHCKGKKIVRGQDTLAISVDKGMPDGEIITFDGASDQNPEYSTGDVKFVVKTSPHPIFTRRGDNLYVKETITLTEALTGFEHSITHLDGNTISIKRNHVTPSGYVQQIASKGMPIYRDSRKFGNLFVEYSVVFPSGKQFSNEEKKTIKNLFNVASASATSSNSEETPVRDEF